MTVQVWGTARRRLRWDTVVSATVACAMPVATSFARGADGADREYRVQVARGDTLIGLARQYVDPAHGWRGLQRLNGVADPPAVHEPAAGRCGAAR
jgi:hypothetical protein